MKSGKAGRGDIRGAVRETGNYSAGEGKKGGIVGTGRRREWREIDCPRLCPRPVVCLHQSSAKRRRQDRAGGGGSEEEDGAKGDERGRRMKSRGQRFVTEVQNFRG